MRHQKTAPSRTGSTRRARLIPGRVRQLLGSSGIALLTIFAWSNTGTDAGSIQGVGSAHRLVAPTPCGQRISDPHYHHVVWIVMENHGYSSVIDSPAAPYLERLTGECGLSTNFHAVAHPSLPNYLALTSGTTNGIADDAEPAAHHLRTANLFHQLRGNWRALEESMPFACDKVTSGSYAARHDPAVYYTDLASTCSRDDVALHGPLDLSAAFTFITPNVCHDMHDCPVSTGDAWLARVVPEILASPEYRARETALFITWDESDTGAQNRVATVVVAPSVPSGVRVATEFSHYSLLRTTEQLLGLPLLGAATSATSMLTSFRL